MKLERMRRRIRVLRMGLAMLAAIYRQDRNLGQIARRIWFVATREGLIGLKAWLLRSVRPPELAAISAIGTQLQYKPWLDQFDLLQPSNVQAARRHLATLNLPDLLIVIIMTRAGLASFSRIVASWKESIHRGWHGAVVASAELSPSEVAALRLEARADPRILILTTSAEIEASRNCFQYTMLCFGSVLLNSMSAYMFLEAAVRNGADIVYSDHDRIDKAGQRYKPEFKPQFSPEYIATYNYFGDCLLLSRAVTFSQKETDSLFQLTLAGFDSLVARLALDHHVEHLPFLLFHTPEPQPRRSHDLPSIPKDGPGVAIIIPTRDGLDHFKPCVDSILQKTSYDLSLVDIVVMDNNSTEKATHNYLDNLGRRPNVSIIKYPHPFNFAEINNVAARSTSREILVFLNNDTIVYDPDWLGKLVWYAKQPDVGVVGCKLLFPDGTIQHGGCAAGASRGTVQHLLNCVPPSEVATSDHTREMSVLTGACLAVRHSVFDKVGGFDTILKITWNDVKFCLDCLSAGYRNIYIADSLLTHDESKTRGRDDTIEGRTRYFAEANYTRRLFRKYFYDDPSYNPNLSVEQTGQLAEPPRVRRPWVHRTGQPVRILLLSAVYKIGFGVPLVIQQHAKKLRELGYDVIVGGPIAENEFSFPGCDRVALGSAKEAAVFALLNDVALAVSHTPPFFEVPIFIGPHIPVLSYDYGEPPAELFPEPTRSYLVDAGHQKRSAAALTTTIATISQAVKDETVNNDAMVLGLANSHLPAWSEGLRPQRDHLRHELGCTHRFVVLTVCRFGVNERAYKGLDKIASIAREFPYLYPDESKNLVWAIAGRGSPEDIKEVERLGFTVFANVSDDRLAELYTAADAYMGFSRWEGYNLGISQALAMGLPTMGSDIPAHREFPIFTSNSELVACSWLANEVRLHTAATPERRGIVYEWANSTARFAAVVEDLLQRSRIQQPRWGASHPVRQGHAA